MAVPIMLPFYTQSNHTLFNKEELFNFLYTAHHITSYNKYKFRLTEISFKVLSKQILFCDAQSAS